MGRHDPDNVTEFAGLTTHNATEMSNRTSNIVGMDPDELPETSFATAIRDLDTADTTTSLWEVPDEAADHIDVQEFNEEAPDGTEAVALDDGGVAIRTHRFQSIINPDAVMEYAQGDFTNDDDEFVDALWHNPTSDYSIINPLTAYEPLEDAIRDEDLGDNMFGEIREYKGGGRVHMDILFDSYTIDTYNDDSDEPIVLGIRTGYDFFGDSCLYFEGFGQDRRCSNSIRAITDKEVIRHAGDDLDERIEDAVENVLEGLGLMVDQMAELIEMAQDIEIDVLDHAFAEPMDHDDNLRAFYELAGFPSYMAQAAASHARTRADNTFLPDMTDVWDGATYALTHEFRGTEDSSRANELVRTASDMVQNPSQVISRVEQNHRTRMATQTAEGEQQTLDGESAHASIAEFSDDVQDLADDFRSMQEELRESLVDDAEDEEAEAEA